MKKRLYRTRDDRKILGVCGGIARCFEIDATIVRIAWLALILLKGCGILLYLIAALVIPDTPTSGQDYTEPKDKPDYSKSEDPDIVDVESGPANDSYDCRVTGPLNGAVKIGCVGSDKSFLML